MFKKNKKNNKGFTLVELVIVIAILAILVGLLAPQYTKYVEKSRKAADASNMDEMVKVFAADPTNELAADTYTIKISADKATGTDKSTTITPGKNTTVVTKLIAEMDKTIPNWYDTVTKSKKWKSGEKAAIIAVVTVNEEGGTSVSYKVDGDGSATDPFANYMKTGTDGIQ
mgnify:CR=1 FL=1